MARFGEVAVHGRDVVPRLDQFDLQRPGIGERHRIVRLIGLPPVAVVPDWHALAVEEGSNAEHAAPVVHGRFDIGNNVASLTDLAREIGSLGLTFCEWIQNFRTLPGIMGPPSSMTLEAL